jgi:uncharacterized protein YdhG (YjbR/CyaY superfamily)
MKAMDIQVSTYISKQNDAARLRLEALRKEILNLNKDIVESWAYSMPAYIFLKKPLAYFCNFKNHIGVYALPNSHTAFLERLKGYKQGRGSVQFPHSGVFPLDLIRDLIQNRLEEIEKNAS